MFELTYRNKKVTELTDIQSKKVHTGGQNLPKKINIHVPQFGTLEYVVELELRFHTRTSNVVLENLSCISGFNLKFYVFFRYLFFKKINFIQSLIYFLNFF